MGGQAFELAILISLKDAASAGADRVSDRLRAMGKEGRKTLTTFQDLRKDFRQGLVLGGIGIAGLAMLVRGARDAGNFEASLHDLKGAFQEVEQSGSVELAKLGDQMNRAEKLGVDLGNKLQGSTQDYLEIFTALKRAGVDVETILTGAGRSAGYLANVTGTITTGAFKEQAKEMGQFGKMYNLKPQDFEASVNLFSALKDRFDVESSELIESSKYFKATASALNMTGLEGAQDVVKVFALLKRNAALEGSQSGTSLTSVFSMFVTHKKEIDKLRKEMGVDLKLFDKKGKFLGWENMFAQAEQFRRLPEAKRMEALTRVFGEQGAKAFGAFIDAGVNGWKQVTEETKKAVPVNDKINAQMATYNAKIEAVQGSWENLKATAFTPLLDSLKPLLDTANEGIGAIQQWAKENPKLASFAVHLVGIGSAAMVVVGGFKAMRAAWGLWKIASAVSGNSGLLAWLQNVRVETDKTAEKVGSSSKWKTAGDRIGRSLGGSLVRTAGTIIAAWAISEIISAKFEEAERAVESRKGTAQLEDLKKERTAVLEKVRAGDLKPEDALPQIEQLNKQIAQAMVQSWQATGIKTGPFHSPSEFAKQMAIANSTFGERLWELKPFDTQASGQARLLEMLAQMKFTGAEHLTNFLDEIRRSGVYTKEQLDLLNSLATQVYPQYADQLRAIQSGSESATEKMRRLSEELQNLRVPNLSSPESGGGTTGGPSTKTAEVPSKASGGRVKREGIVFVHGGEDIVPAQVTRKYEEKRMIATATAGRAFTNNGGFNFNVYPERGSALAEHPQAFGQYAMDYITHNVKRQLERN